MKLSTFAHIIAVISFLSMNEALFAQIAVDGDFRLRSEYRHGFQSLLKENNDAAFFTSQRSRVILGYKSDKYSVKFAIQDVRTWGSQPQAGVSDGLLSVHEAWVDYHLSKKVSLKAGRMELVYDNHRILGNLDWAQQGRKHDVALVKFNDSTFTIHAGFAFNQDKEQSVTTLYTVPNSYKAMQFLWLNKQLKNVNLSALFLNNGTQFTRTNDAGEIIDYETKFSQTTGVNVEYKKAPFFLNGFSYIQTGRDSKDRSINAYDANVEAGFQITKKTVVSIGAEYLSGTDNGITNVNNSFAPLYGTNHAFNGYMDYFYVGNHANNVGLRDAYIRIKKSVFKGTIALDVHYFQSAARVVNPESATAMDNALGTEIDLTIRQPLTKELTLQAGYSQMFGTSTMAVLNAGDESRTANWAYLWIIFKPDFMKKTSDK